MLLKPLLSFFFSRTQRQADLLFVALCGAFTVYQFSVVIGGPFGLSADEAHYWEWSQRLDYSYYSKGPLIAWAIALSTALFGDSEFAVRLPALLSSLAFSILLYLHLRQISSPQIALLTWVAVRSAVWFAVMGMVMTTDPLALLFWLAALVAAHRAVERDEPRWWIYAGVATGLALWSKYTALIIFPSFALFLLLASSCRHHLRSAGFLIGCSVVGLFLVPPLVWNASHDWVNVQHNAGHIVSHRGFGLHAKYLPELLGGQLGLVGPILFGVLIAAVVAGVRRWRLGDNICGLYVCSALPLAALCLALSLTKRVYANWPMPLYLAAFLLLAYLLTKQLSSLGDPAGRSAFARWLAAGVVFNVGLLVLVTPTFFGETYQLPPKNLPTKKLIGWRELAAEVDRQLPAGGFVIAGNYDLGAAISFYSEKHPEVFCAPVGGRRMNQYDVWGGVEAMKGRDAVIVLKHSEQIENLRSKFSQINPQSFAREISYDGKYLRTFHLFIGHGYNGDSFARPGKF